MTKFFLFILFLGACIVGLQAGDTPKDKLKVNVSTSTVEWTARKVTGKHNGSVKIKEGTLHVSDGVLIDGTFTMDMTTIEVTDLTGESKGKLEGHLRSDDFFSTASFPTATLVTTKVTQKGVGQFEVVANLTIKGITAPITFMAQLIPDGKKYKATALVTVDRTLYNIKYRSGKFYDDLGDSALYDEFDLNIVLMTE